MDVLSYGSPYIRITLICFTSTSHSITFISLSQLVSQPTNEPTNQPVSQPAYTLKSGPLSYTIELNAHTYMCVCMHTSILPLSHILYVYCKEDVYSTSCVYFMCTHFVCLCALCITYLGCVRRHILYMRYIFIYTSISLYVYIDCHCFHCECTHTYRIYFE